MDFVRLEGGWDPDKYYQNFTTFSIRILPIICCSLFLAAPSSSRRLVVGVSVRWSASPFVRLPVRPSVQDFCEKVTFIVSNCNPTYQPTYLCESNYSSDSKDKKLFSQKTFFQKQFFYINKLSCYKKVLFYNNKITGSKKNKKNT